MVGLKTRLAAACLAASVAGACATRPAVEAEPARNKSTDAQAVQRQPAPRTQAAPAPAPSPAPASSPAPIPPAPARAAAETPALPETAANKPAAASTAQQLAVLRVEAGALVTRVNGDPRLACTNPDCRIPLPPGTHRFTVGYKEAVTRAGTGVTYASLRSREIEVTLEPGHTYSVSAAGKSTPRWWIAVEDETASKIVYDDREARPE